MVAYFSSEDDDEPPVAKKRKLPSLSPSLTTPAPVDNPALHQGRVRTTPHVDGQYAAYVYVSLAVERGSALNKVIHDACDDAKAAVPALNNSWSAGELSKKSELHISLSRPTYLRAHQREVFKRAVKNLSRQFAPFTASFATFSELINDERSRTFLTMEIGAGHRELRALSDALTPTLQSIRQKEFYTNPRFHASFAWALLDRHASKASSEEGNEPENIRISSPASLSPEPVPEADFPTISHLPHDLISTINDRHRAKLSAPKTGTFDVSEVTVKIGKEVCTWCLSG